MTANQLNWADFKKHNHPLVSNVMKHLAYFVINLRGQIVVSTNRQEWKELWSKGHLEKTFQPFCLAQENLAASLVL